MYDVIVVGAGPAGTAAAKRCAEYGLNTLILERRRLPRDKVCGGMVMGPVAHALIKQEFGEIPYSVLSNPPSLAGYIIHVPGVGNQEINNFTPLVWRRNLDYWMNQKAQAKGVEVRDGARVVGLNQRGWSFVLKITSGKGEQELEAKFIVGADGTGSLIRRVLFPELKINYRQAYQEGYPGKLDLDKNRYHWFFSVDYKPPFFSVHQKDGYIIVNVSGQPGQAKWSMNQAKSFLAANYNFDINQKPVLRSGCVELKLHEELVSHAFLPAKGNALLVGDAAGFILPVSGEGIGTAVKSGLLAADSLMRAVESGGKADKIYLTEIESIISIIGELSPWSKKVDGEIEAGGGRLPEVMRDAYQSTLRMF